MTDTVLRFTFSTLRSSHGAALSVAATNLGKLNHISGPGLPLAPVAIAANTSVSYAIVYEGNEASDAADDISVTATLTENVTGSISADSCAATSIRLEMSPVWAAPENPCTNRHIYGVGERVRFNVQPRLSSVTLSTIKYDTQDVDTSEYERFGTNVTVDASAERIYTCPISANYVPPVKVSRGDVEYSPFISLVEPQEVITRGAGWGVNKVDIFNEDKRRCWPSGSVGMATLVTTNYIGPMTVSFRGIAVSELPCDEEDTITGCLTNVMWRTHTVEAGAGKAYPIANGNFWFVDSAGLSPEIANWEPGGELVLKIPIGWHRRSDFLSDDWFLVNVPDYETWWDSESRSLVINRQYTQRFTVDADGVCKTEKYGHWISRSRSCRVILDGRTLQWSHPIW